MSRVSAAAVAVCASLAAPPVPGSAVRHFWSPQAPPANITARMIHFFMCQELCKQRSLMKIVSARKPEKTANKTRQAGQKFTKSPGADLAEEWSARGGVGSGLFPAALAGAVAHPGKASAQRGDGAPVPCRGSGHHRRTGQPDLPSVH